MLALKLSRPAVYPIPLTNSIQEAEEHDGVSVPLLA